MMSNLNFSFAVQLESNVSLSDSMLRGSGSGIERKPLYLWTQRDPKDVINNINMKILCF